MIHLLFNLLLSNRVDLTYSFLFRKTLSKKSLFDGNSGITIPVNCLKLFHKQLDQFNHNGFILDDQEDLAHLQAKGDAFPREEWQPRIVNFIVLDKIHVLPE